MPIKRACSSKKTIIFMAIRMRQVFSYENPTRFMVFVPKMIEKCQTCGNKHPYYQGKCPLTDLIRLRPKMQDLPKVFFGPAPSVFVGHSNYPKVFVGPMGALEEDKAVLSDNPEGWFGMDYE